MGALVLSGCASLPQISGDLPTRARVDGVPYYPQEENQCGPASLAMVLGHRGLEIEPEDLSPLLYIPAREGSLAVELEAQARQHQLLAYPLAPRLNDLLAELAAGNPVLIMQNLGFSWYPRWHFAVAFGYDLDSHHMLLRSGPQSEQRMPLGLFLRTWSRADHWALVVTPVDQLPATAQPLSTARAINNLEQTGHWNVAHRGYLEMLAQWPDDSLALFGAGNTAYLLGDYSAAGRYLQRRVELHPDTAETWNNLAHTEAALGCPVNARLAAQCALQLHPARESFSATLRQMQGLDDHQGQCAKLPDCPNLSNP